MSKDLQQSKPVLIIIAGLVGGLGAWVWATTVGPSPLLGNPWVAIPAYMFLGAIAGFLGVYLVAKTDPAQTAHAIAFSLACGVFWGPVISGAEAMVKRSQVEAQSQHVAVQQVALLRTQDEVAQRTEALQVELNNALRRVEQLDAAKRRLAELSQGGIASSGLHIRNQLEAINTGEIRSELQSSSENVARISRDLARISLAERRSE